MKEAYLLRNTHLDKFQRAGKTVWKRWEDIMIEWWFGLEKPSKRIDPNYSQQTSYDAYMPLHNAIIRIEIKTARVTESWNQDDIFIDKALFSTDNEPFWLNFQQLKPQYCDVFIFIAVYRDKLKFRVLSSNEVRNNKYFSKWQHSGNAGNEGQLHIKETNIHDFDGFLVETLDLQLEIIKAYERQNNN